MKRFYLLMVGIIFSVSSWADPISLTQLPNDYNEDPQPHHAPALLPSADYDDGMLSIYSPYAIEDMAIVIKDANGVVLYSTMVDVSNTAIVALPNGIFNSMATLEIIYGDHHLYGEF